MPELYKLPRREGDMVYHEADSNKISTSNRDVSYYSLGRKVDLLQPDSLESILEDKVVLSTQV